MNCIGWTDDTSNSTYWSEIYYKENNIGNFSNTLKSKSTIHNTTNVFEVKNTSDNETSITVYCKVSDNYGAERVSSVNVNK